MTADDVAVRLRSMGQDIGKSTVYRHLNRLVSDGIVRKYAGEGGSACFQYLDEHISDTVQYHLKCNTCDKLLHADDVSISTAVKQIYDAYGFTVNPATTVICGVCGECNGEV